ncbi:MAG TPA: LacI family DNA-binding transcriptional regulator [Ktedonobacteraceae bacterium]|nr:LacI family DNA-binding transcriptional regulator [Ktedonobacteraceae bacterium]
MRQQEVSIAASPVQPRFPIRPVSRALCGNSLISADTRERIERLAREMGYTPNAIAQSLQTQQTGTIGLVVTTIADPFLGDVVRDVETVAREAGLSVFLSASYNQPEQEMAIIETFRHRCRTILLIHCISRKLINCCQIPSALQPVISICWLVARNRLPSYDAQDFEIIRQGRNA